MIAKYLLLVLCIFPIYRLQGPFYNFESLNEFNRNEDKDKILQFLNESQDPYIQTQAAYSLIKLKYPKAKNALLKCLSSQHWDLRFYSLKALLELELSEEDISKIKNLMIKEENPYILELLSKLKDFKKQESP